MSTVLAALVNGAILGALLTFIVELILRMSPRPWFNAATKYAIWSLLLVVVVAMPLLYLAAEGPSIATVKPASEPATRVPTARSGATAPLHHSILLPQPAPRGLAPAHENGRSLVGRSPEPMGDRCLCDAPSCGCEHLLIDSKKGEGCRRTGIFGDPPGTLAHPLRNQAAGFTRLFRRIATPMVAGLWRPAILIPVRLLGQLSEEEWDQVGLHEAAHVARWDDFALIAQRILEALLCLHPVVHWISRRTDLEREVACDDFVLGATGRARSYAACLTRVLELAGGMDPSSIAAAVIDEGSHFTRRVQALLDQTRHAGTRLLRGRLTGFVVLFVTLAWLGWRAPLVVAFAAPPAQAPAVRIIAQARTRAQPQQAPPPAPTEPLRRASTPASICLVLDTSGSMSDKQRQSYVARLALAQDFRPDDEICIVNFADDSFLDLPFTKSAKRISEAVSSSEARGGSAVRNAIGMTLDYMKSKGTRAKKVMIVVTDGADTSSKETQDQLLGEVKNSGIPIYSIGLLNRDAGAAKKSLRELSEASGGRDYYAEELGEVQKAASEIMGLVRSP